MFIGIFTTDFDGACNLYIIESALHSTAVPISSLLALLTVCTSGKRYINNGTVSILVVPQVQPTWFLRTGVLHAHQLWLDASFSWDR